MQVYFIDNDDYFTRRKMYGDDKGFYQDNIERCVFFARGVIETIRKLRWKPDVIYCQGWFSAIAPIYIKKAFAEDPCFRGTKLVFSVFANDFTGPLHGNVYSVVKREGILKADIIELKDKNIDCTALCKVALKFCDGLIISDETPHAADLREFAQERGLPVLDATDQKLDVEKYDQFFEQFNPNSATDED